MGDCATTEEKRAANLAKREKDKADEVAKIKANKAQCAAGRAQEKSAKEQAEAEKQRKLAEAAAKREENIKAKEEKRNAGAANAPVAKKNSSKYSRKDVLELKAVFDKYDHDGSGEISLEEFKKHLNKQKNDKAPKAGQKSTLEERNSAKGLSIADLSESVFHEMDNDDSGNVSFAELAKVFFPYATKEDFATMMAWVAPEPEPEPEPEPTLSDEGRKEIKAMFKLYDKDKNGSIEKTELFAALKSSGIEKEEVYKMVADYDGDENGKLNLEEFTTLMWETGAYS